MRVWLALPLALALAACSAPGYVNSSGNYVMGSSVFGDEPLARQNYPDYPTYLANEEYLGDKLKSLPKDQQICVLRAGFVQLPQYLQTQLNDFATGRTTLMESEYVALQKRINHYINDPEVARAARARSASNCGVDFG